MSAAVSVVSCSSVGSLTAAKRSAWRPTASSNRLRTKRALPKPAIARLGLDDGPQRLASGLVEVVAKVAAHPLEDLDELVRGVVGEVDEPREAALQSGVGVDEFLHLRRVAGGDQGEVVAVVLHVLDDGVDRLPAEVLLAATSEGVRLVDEQRAAERRLEHGSRLRRRLADVAGDELRSVGLHEVALGHEAEGAQDLAEQPGHGRLAGTGVAGEDQVVARLQRRQLAVVTELLDAQQAGQPAHVGLDRLEADEIVELGEQLLDRAGRREVGGG